jgi:NADPH:quinone reductase-like Zn-dependent oxidoreductase
VRAYEIQNGDGIDALVVSERATHEPGPGQVRVRVRANSVNYRDLMIISDPVPRGVAFPRIPNSDGAGEVTAVGDGVDGIAVGDRVAGCFFQAWVDGAISAAAMASAMGGAVDGMLAEEVVLAADGVVPIPDHLTFEEAATLPCAALTAWHALVEKGQVKAGETVLLLGTGGVSIFALQFCVMHGARAIVLSSSDEKLARAREMGAWQTLNYREHPEWHGPVAEMTGGGVDHVVEVGGAGTLERSVEAARVGGHVALIGILTGGQVNPVAIMRKSLTVHGIYVGSRAMFGRMNGAIAANGLKPVIDQTVAFDEAPAAYHAMQAAGHFGKIVIGV